MLSTTPRIANHIVSRLQNRLSLVPSEPLPESGHKFKRLNGKVGSHAHTDFEKHRSDASREYHDERHAPRLAKIQNEPHDDKDVTQKPGQDGGSYQRLVVFSPNRCTVAAMV